MPNRRYNQFFETLETKPILVTCNFVVDSANGNGFGVRSLKGPGFLRVFMHTSASPATGNPNPPAGYIIVQFQDTYNKYLSGFSGFVSPLSGSNVTSVTANDVYVITSLGTATLAQWQAKGLPVGVTPALGVPFVATASGSIGGSAAVQVPSVSGVNSIEVVGDPNQTISSNASTKAVILGVQCGAYMILQCLGPTSVSNPTPIPVAPADGSVVGLSFYMSGSRITVQGE